MTRILSYPLPTHRLPAKATPSPGLRFNGNPDRIHLLRFYQKAVFEQNTDRFEKAMDGVLEELNKMGQGAFQKITSGQWGSDKGEQFIQIIKNNNINDSWLYLCSEPQKAGFWPRETIAYRIDLDTGHLGNPTLPQGVKDKVQTIRDLLNPKTIRCFPDMEYLGMDFNPDIDTLD